ncbi:hypothetical protein ACVFI8_15470 [Agarivorans sp. MS3-6]
MWVAFFEKSAPPFQLSFIFQRVDGTTTLNLDCENLHYSLRQTSQGSNTASESVQQLSMLVCSDFYAMLQQVPKQFASSYHAEQGAGKAITWTLGEEVWQWHWQNKYEPAMGPVFVQLDDLIQRMPDAALAGGTNIKLR